MHTKWEKSVGWTEAAKGGMVMISIRSFFAGSVIILAVVAKISQGMLTEEAKIVRHIPTTHKIIALTFDDGPHYKTTPEVLKVLKEKKVKATFFMLGENVEKYPELVAKVAREGHEIGTHAYSHRHLKDLTQAECIEELDRTEKAIEKVVPKPQLFRPPGGLYNDMVLEEAQKRDYTTVLWSIDPTDWMRPSIDYVVSTVLKKAASGGIVLLHDGMYPLPTPKATAIIIDRLRAKGYTIVTVSELLKYNEVRETGKWD